ncbi:VWA domain-containing protein [uncultured Bacteroides sp.]|uniref:vWA domain-containing protein n=1 Tax=uncultured Bacteroides sp. TaxID=162156 RepID=UPI0025CFD6FF|nr:VWA domain-containing protein [uncultured Bacteroides sp.]
MNRTIGILGILLFTIIGNLRADGNERKVMLVLDISSSMLAKDIAPNRLARCKDLARIFIEQHPDVPIGITAFAGVWEDICIPRTDHNTVQSHLKSLRTGRLKDGTAIGSALLSAASFLTGTGGTIILITDGVENCGTVSTSTAIEILKHYNIKLNVIGIGINGMVPFPYQTPEGEKIINVKMTFDPKYLSEIATATGGRYYGVSSIQDFLNMLHELDKPTWLELPQGVRASEDCHMTEEVMKWVIKRVTMGGSDIPLP